MVSHRIVSITLDTLDDLPVRCRRCVFWELDPSLGERIAELGDPALEKEAWVSAAMLEWGAVGKLAYVGGAPAGYVLFAPPGYVPRAVAFPTSPVSPDATLLLTGQVLPDFTGGGIARALVQTVVRDLIRRKVRAIEAFGDAQWTKPACVLPADFLLALGFKTVAAHPRFPRLRLELRGNTNWRADVEYAVERLIGSMPPVQPVGSPATVSGSR